MRFGIVVFPGTWSDGDCYHVVKSVLGQDVRYVWHKDRDLSDLECLILPGGFSYGDYLRTGAIARFSPVMEEVERFAQRGGLVVGICNGFQILCEAGLLPGALIQNDHVQFRCQWVDLRVENSGTPFTSECWQGQVLRVPISHGEGNYYADADTLASLNSRGQIVFRYCNPQGDITQEANPNGSLENVAGIVNDRGNVLGMMPHPERCCEAVLGGTDGRLIFESMLRVVV
ncbi:phosphoribosylformylglycinamidine synthase subunit PurQ [SAR202 cluster bacterium AC-647-N09_OGT_505m]|nr:phosphoribosylformylglycinamidine synthase subunit PurQ [SAR202 cluster bacterium AC-647-N09_OGT_505m]